MRRSDAGESDLPPSLSGRGPGGGSGARSEDCSAATRSSARAINCSRRSALLSSAAASRPAVSSIWAVVASASARLRVGWGVCLILSMSSRAEGRSALRRAILPRTDIVNITLRPTIAITMIIAPTSASGSAPPSGAAAPSARTPSATEPPAARAGQTIVRGVAGMITSRTGGWSPRDRTRRHAGKILSADATYCTCRGREAAVARPWRVGSDRCPPPLACRRNPAPSSNPRGGWARGEGRRGRERRGRLDGAAAWVRRTA